VRARAEAVPAANRLLEAHVDRVLRHELAQRNATRSRPRRVLGRSGAQGRAGEPCEEKAGSYERCE
jgi:hypothetical protein